MILLSKYSSLLNASITIDAELILKVAWAVKFLKIGDQ